MVAEVEEGWESPSAVLGTGGLSLDSSGLTCPLQKKTPCPSLLVHFFANNHFRTVMIQQSPSSVLDRTL